MAASPVRAVVFDLDGTLVDSVGDLHAVAARLFLELGLPPLPLDAIASFVGAGIPALVERCFAATGRSLSGAELASAIERYKVLYAAAPAEHSTPYAGVADALAALRSRGFALGVCTNKAEDISRAVLAGVGLGEFFSVVVGGDTLPVRKPDPRMLQHSAKGLGVDLRLVFFVGDSEIDAETAAAAGVPFALFTRGYRKAPIDSLPRAVAFDDFERLPDLIHGMVVNR